MPDETGPDDKSSKIDYQSGAKNRPQTGKSSEKKTEKVVVGEVVIPKKTFGRKAKEAVIAADFKTVGEYIIWDMAIPAIKNMIVGGVERAIFGTGPIRTRNNITGAGRESRVTFNPYPYSQHHSNPLSGRSGVIDARSRTMDRGREDRERYILPTREDADRVLDEMTEIVDTQGFVTVATMKELMGIPSSHIDYKWGWKSLGGIRSSQVQEGFLVDFPTPVTV